MDRDQEPLSRRGFLAGVAGLAGTALSSTALGKVLAYGEAQPLILGQGSFRYECHHDWLTAPAGIKFGDTHGLAQDSKGLIYLAHTVHPTSEKKDAVIVYDAKGDFVRSFGNDFAGGAHGLDIRKESKGEFLYHCDTNRKLIVKTDLLGNVLWAQGAPKASGKYQNGEPFVPTNICFAPDGGFYVADGYGSSWIHRYNKNAEYVSTFGGKGSEAGQVNCPHGIWLDNRQRDPLLVVADRSNRRLQYFSLEGESVGFATEGIRLPCHFSIQRDLMLIPDLESVITILDKDNRVVAQLGDGAPTNLRDAPRNQYVNGKFIHPHDAIFLQNGDILVSEWVPTGRVTLLKKVK